MSLDFRTLARRAGAHPVTNVGIHAWPNVAGRNELLRRTNAGVGHVVDGVEDAATMWFGQEGSGNTCRHVADDGHTAKRYLFKLESRGC